MKVTLQNKEEQRFELDIPLSCAEITWNQFPKFKARRNKYHAVLVDEDLSDEDKTRESIFHFSNMVKTLVKGDTRDIPFTLPGDDVEVFLESGYTLGVHLLNTELSIIRIYCHLVNMMEGYQPEKIPTTFELEWWDFDEKGKKVPCKYFIEPDRALRLLTDKSYTNGEVIELMYFTEKQEKTIEKQILAYTYDSNLEFALGKVQMAILLRNEEHEKFPHSQRDIDRFLAHYEKVFESLPLNIVFDVRFFLLSILKNFAKAQVIKDFSKDSNPSTLKKPQKG